MMQDGLTPKLHQSPFLLILVEAKKKLFVIAEQVIGKYQKESSDWSISRDHMITRDSHKNCSSVLENESNQLIFYLPAMTDDSLEVKGDAIEASPKRTT